MCFLAEMLAIMVVWLSSAALGQFGIALDKAPLQPRAQAQKQERIVSRSPRTPIQVPVDARPCPDSVRVA